MLQGFEQGPKQSAEKDENNKSIIFRFDLSELHNILQTYLILLIKMQVKCATILCLYVDFNKK